MAYVDIDKYEQIKEEIEKVTIEISRLNPFTTKYLLGIGYLSALKKSKEHYEAKIPLIMYANYYNNK